MTMALAAKNVYSRYVLAHGEDQEQSLNKAGALEVIRNFIHLKETYGVRELLALYYPRSQCT